MICPGAVRRGVFCVVAFVVRSRAESVHAERKRKKPFGSMERFACSKRKFDRMNDMMLCKIRYR